jgi:hypothetical protein
MRRASLLFALLAACGDGPTAPSLPVGAVEISPPAFYQGWWNLTEACSGRSASMSKVRWYVMPGVTLFDLKGQLVSGYSVASSNLIVLAANVVDEGRSVRHEMLHQLLGPGITGHPRSEFVGKCGGTVYCSSRCMGDGGPPPAADPAAISLTPRELDVSVEVTPANPSLENNGGRIAMTVLAANRSGRPAEVTLPGSDRIGFSFNLTTDQGRLWWAGVTAETPETTRFAAGEVKRYVFDFTIEGHDFNLFPRGPNLPPGNYTFSGAYGGTSASNPPTVTVIR